MKAGSRKYIQKITIRRGIPRMAFTTTSTGYLTKRFCETHSSPAKIPMTIERVQDTTASQIVSASPPMGPLG